MDNLVGMTFGRLTVLSQLESSKRSGETRRMWECVCTCGNKKSVSTLNLRRGSIRSCGCLFRETSSANAIKSHTKHNLSKSHPRQYSIWKGIRSRCNNPMHPEYHCYGGKGVAICEEWNNPTNFVEWWLNQCCDINAKLDVDRIDPSGNYEPANCRLITRSENASRGAKYNLTVNDVTKTCCEWNRILHRSKAYLQKIWRKYGESAAYDKLVTELSYLSK